MPADVAFYWEICRPAALSRQSRLDGYCVVQRNRAVKQVATTRPASPSAGGTPCVSPRNLPGEIGAGRNEDHVTAAIGRAGSLLIGDGDLALDKEDRLVPGIIPCERPWSAPPDTVTQPLVLRLPQETDQTLADRRSRPAPSGSAHLPAEKSLIVKILVFLSIAATMFIALSVVLAALDLRHLQPIAQCLYFQLLL